MTQLLRFPGSRAGQQQWLSEIRSTYAGMIVEDPDYALAQDPSVYVKLRRDTNIAHALDTRVNAVIARTWQLEPPTDAADDKALAEVVEELINRIPSFGEVRRNIYESGLLGGRGYGYIEGPSPGKRGRTRIAGRMSDWWVPRRIRHVDKRQFRYEPIRDDRGNPVGQRLTVARASGNWQEFTPVTPEEMRCLIRMVYNNRADRLGMGEGIAPSLYMLFRAKALAVRDLFAANEKWGRGGLVVVKMDPDDEGSTDRTNDLVAAAYLDRIDQMMSRHVLVMGKNDDIQVVAPSNNGTQTILETIRYADQMTTRYVTGALRPSGGDTETGARAQGEVEQETTDVLVQADRGLENDAITEGLVSCLCVHNQSNLRALGLGDASRPRFVTNAERKSNPIRDIQGGIQMIAAGIPVSKREFYERSGFTQPADDEEVFAGVAHPVGGMAGEAALQPAAVGVPDGFASLPHLWRDDSRTPREQWDFLASLKPEMRDKVVAVLRDTEE